MPSKIINKREKFILTRMIKRIVRRKLYAAALLDLPLRASKKSNIVDDISKDQGRLWKTLSDKQKEMYLDDELDEYMGGKSI